jgi:hypothetical protein
MALRSEVILQFLTQQVAVTQDLCQQPAADRFAAMNWHDRAAPVRVSQKVVAALDADLLESKPA